MTVGSQDGVRTWKLAPTSMRRRCSCCGRRATHYGLGDGVVLMMGCEFTVRMWLRDPLDHLRRHRRQRAAEHQSVAKQEEK